MLLKKQNQSDISASAAMFTLLIKILLLCKSPIIALSHKKLSNGISTIILSWRNQESVPKRNRFENMLESFLIASSLMDITWRYEIGELSVCPVKLHFQYVHVKAK
nr:hypothetical transcript [Hymenolepis microstoma]